MSEGMKQEQQFLKDQIIEIQAALSEVVSLHKSLNMQFKEVLKMQHGILEMMRGMQETVPGIEVAMAEPAYIEEVKTEPEGQEEANKDRAAYQKRRRVGHNGDWTQTLVLGDD